MNRETTSLEHLPLGLRLLAFVLLPVGFIGFLTTEDGFFDPSSVFTVAFSLGIVCAAASIYLGIFLHDPNGSAEDA